MTLIVLMLREAASCMTACPTPLLAPFCIIVSPAVNDAAIVQLMHMGVGSRGASVTGVPLLYCPFSDLSPHTHKYRHTDRQTRRQTHTHTHTHTHTNTQILIQTLREREEERDRELITNNTFFKVNKIIDHTIGGSWINH